MLRPFAHPLTHCCILLRVVGSCCVKFEPGQTLATCKRMQQLPTLELLRPFARSFRIRFVHMQVTS